MNELVGRVALVAGANGGIGSAVAGRLASMGATLALGVHAGRERADRVAAVAARARVDALDGTDAAAVALWVDAIAAELGPPAILCNCVGWVGPMRPFLETIPEDWPAILDLELVTGLNLASVVAPHMVQAGWGRILNLASDSVRAGESGLAVSAAARGGLAVFGKSLARELARHSITVNTVCPGPVETPALAALAQSPMGERVLPAMLRAIPMRRAGRPEEVAAVFGFLCTEDAGYITGQTLSVSGGLTMA